MLLVSGVIVILSLYYRFHHVIVVGGWCPLFDLCERLH